jgi:hypothetical protein
MFTSFRFAFVLRMVSFRSHANETKPRAISLLSFETKAKRNRGKNESETKVARRNESTKAKRKRKCESETKVPLGNESTKAKRKRKSHESFFHSCVLTLAHSFAQ